LDVAHTHVCYVVRVIYFAMLPTGALNNANIVVFVILGEVPVYLFFTIYTSILFFWYRPQLANWGKDSS